MVVLSLNTGLPSTTIPLMFPEVYEAVASKMPSDGWIVGRVTMAEYGEGIVEEKPVMEGPKTMHTTTFVGKRRTSFSSCVRSSRKTSLQGIQSSYR